MKLTHTIRQHLKDNSGDGYTWMLFMTLALLLIFGALFLIMSSAINMRDIRNNIDEAADFVFTDVKESAYDRLTNGSTNYSFTIKNEQDIMASMAEKLNAQLNEHDSAPYISKIGDGHRLSYQISDMYFEYIPGVILNSGKILGDINNDNTVNKQDLMLAQAYIDGENPTGVTLALVDVNDDGVANNKDIRLLKGLIKYFEEHPIDSLESAEEKSSALLMLTFKVTVPIKYGTVNFGNDVDEYSYCSAFSFKAAR